MLAAQDYCALTYVNGQHIERPASALTAVSSAASTQTTSKLSSIGNIIENTQCKLKSNDISVQHFGLGFFLLPYFFTFPFTREYLQEPKQCKTQRAEGTHLSRSKCLHNRLLLKPPKSSQNPQTKFEIQVSSTYMLSKFIIRDRKPPPSRGECVHLEKWRGEVGGGGGGAWNHLSHYTPWWWFLQSSVTNCLAEGVLCWILFLGQLLRPRTSLHLQLLGNKTTTPRPPFNCSSWTIKPFLQ